MRPAILTFLATAQDGDSVDVRAAGVSSWLCLVTGWPLLKRLALRGYG